MDILLVALIIWSFCPIGTAVVASSRGPMMAYGSPLDVCSGRSDLRSPLPTNWPSRKAHDCRSRAVFTARASAPSSRCHAVRSLP